MLDWRKFIALSFQGYFDILFRFFIFDSKLYKQNSIFLFLFRDSHFELLLLFHFHLISVFSRDNQWNPVILFRNPKITFLYVFCQFFFHLSCRYSSVLCHSISGKYQLIIWEIQSVIFRFRHRLIRLIGNRCCIFITVHIPSPGHPLFLISRYILTGDQIFHSHQLSEYRILRNRLHQKISVRLLYLKIIFTEILVISIIGRRIQGCNILLTVPHTIQIFRIFILISNLLDPVESTIWCNCLVHSFPDGPAGIFLICFPALQISTLFPGIASGNNKAQDHRSQNGYCQILPNPCTIRLCHADQQCYDRIQQK